MSEEILNEDVEKQEEVDEPLDYAMSLVKHTGVKYSDWQIKALGLQLVLLSLSETQAERVKFLSSAVKDLEKEVFSNMDRIRDMESKDLISLYKMASDNISKSKECIEDALDSIDWNKLQNDLRSIGAKEKEVPANVTKAAEEILKGMAELYPISRKLKQESLKDSDKS